MEANATDVNDETHEIRVDYWTVTRGMRPFILDASLYRATKGLFPNNATIPTASQQ
jgi:hypothetical protein